MKLDLADPAIRSLVAAPSPAALTLCREDGEAVVSPVWFGVQEDAFEAERDLDGATFRRILTG